MGLVTASNATQIFGAMNALFYVGGFIGCFFNAWYADRYGRKVAIATGSVTVLISAALLAGSVNVAMFIAFRFTTGFGYASWYHLSEPWNTKLNHHRVLMLLISVPLWITEFVPPKGRGPLANIHAIMVNIGYLVSAYVGVGFFYYQGGSGKQWRAPLALSCLAPLINLAIIPFVPESPRFLLTKGRSEEAWAIVRDLHFSNDDPSHDYAKKEFYQIQKQLQLDGSLNSSWKEMLVRPSYRKRMFIACGLLSLIYCTGTLVIASAYLSPFGLLFH
jgi:MFS family permease